MGKMIIKLDNIWDFHIDLVQVQHTPVVNDYLLEQIDLPTAARIGGFFTATCHKPGQPPPHAGVPRDKQLADLEDQVRIIRGAKGLTLVLSAAEVEGLGRHVLHSEGIYFIEGTRDLDLIDWLWEQGFRSVAPLYNADNALGGGATGDPPRGLTRLGRDFAIRAWEKGFLLDCAHANHKTKEDLVALALETGNRLNYSHGFLGAPIFSRWGERGLPLKTTRRIFESGGLVGLSPHPGFLGTFDRFLEEIETLAEISPDQVVLGSDFAGMNSPGPDGNRQFEECKGIWNVPGLAERLADAHGKDFARAFCGETLKTYLQRTLP
jgi:microsomal dipeptidase-like Zn-dependent dipeptidase